MSTNAFTPAFQPIFFAPAVPAPAYGDSDVAIHDDASLEEASYALVRSGPPVAADEVECDVDAIEITARWGAQVLTVAHLDGANATFWVGEGSEIALPEEALGAARAAIVAGGQVLVPANASAEITSRATGQTVTLNGPRELQLSSDARIVLAIGAITFDVATVRKGKPVAPVGVLSRLRSGATGFVGLSFLGHAAIVASLAMFMPKMTDDAEAIDRDQVLMMQKYLNASAQAEQERIQQDGPASDQAGGQSTGERTKGDEGKSGTTRPVTTSGRLAIKGDQKESQFSRKEELAIAREFGMLGILKTGAPDPNAPATPWGEEPSGKDAKSAVGEMWATTIDDAMGFGFGLEGTGEGGGGNGAGYGLDNVHTVGNGGGNGPGVGLGKCLDPNGKCDGMGIGTSPGHGGHTPKGPTMRPQPMFNDGGHLPAEVIQRIVRQNFGRFRLCYDAGLRTNPSLTGRVVTKFVIARDGSVSMSQDGGSDMPDKAVTSCIVRSFGSLSFPSPQGGAAFVTYPLMLAPGDS
jgi:hypothetical protein